MSDPKIVAVVVAFHPNVALLNRLIDATATAVSSIVVVNNDRGDWTAGLNSPVFVHVPERNIGLGAAYNLGAEYALGKGATHLLLLDQDSVPGPGMIQRLLDRYSRSEPIGAVGPVWRDARTGKLAGLAVGFGSKKVPKPDEVLKVEFLISSGSLISLAAFADIGPFDEMLFIEHVDTDWVLRAKAKRYSLYGVGDAVLEHVVGDSVFELPWSKRCLFLYAPERTYYLVRNSIRLWMRPYATWRWRLFDFWRLSGLLVLHLTFAPYRVARMHSMMQGVRDAFRPQISERPVVPS